MNVDEYKKIVNRKRRNVKNKNFKFVKVKEMRLCKYCCNAIPAGEECLTINKKMHGRQWVCEDCVQKVLNYREALALRGSVAFGDEGAYMAYDEYVDECESDLDEIGFFDED